MIVVKKAITPGICLLRLDNLSIFLRRQAAPNLTTGNAKKSRGNAGQNGTNAGTNSKRVNKTAGQTTKSSVNFLYSYKLVTSS